MQINYNEIHNLILSKCKSLPKIYEQIEINGKIALKKTELDLFSFLVKTIISQQISNKISDIIWKKLCNNLYSNNLNIANFKNLKFLIKNLKKINISKRKTSYICSIYESIKNNEIELNAIYKMENDEIRNFLERFKGIGPWTCDMILIFFLNRLNVFPKDDLIIKKMMQIFELKEGKKINFYSIFSPHMSILSLHFWKMSERVL